MASTWGLSLGALVPSGQQQLSLGDLTLSVVPTPGHTSDSVCLLLHDQDPTLLTGDTVLGRGTSVIAYPDGSLADYLSALGCLTDLVTRYGIRRAFPGHGPVIDHLAPVLAEYRAHRQQRLEQVRWALAQGAGNAREVVEKVYVDVDPALWPAAELSVQAQLDYLQITGHDAIGSGASSEDQ